MCDHPTEGEAETDRSDKVNRERVTLRRATWKATMARPPRATAYGLNGSSVEVVLIVFLVEDSRR
jgi:hypothetical protein